MWGKYISRVKREYIVLTVGKYIYFEETHPVCWQWNGYDWTGVRNSLCYNYTLDIRETGYTAITSHRIPNFKLLLKIVSFVNGNQTFIYNNFRNIRTRINPNDISKQWQHRQWVKDEKETLRIHLDESKKNEDEKKKIWTHKLNQGFKYK